jgi:hypothetical protein
VLRRGRGTARRATGAIGALLVALAAACAAPGPPVLPAGIAELQLPTDAAGLGRIAAEDDAAGRRDRRQAVLDGLNRQLLMAPPAPGLVPELFDFVVALAPRMESRVVSPAWGSYLYTTYQRDLTAEPAGSRPRRTPAELDAVLDRWIEFYQIRANPRLGRPSAESAGFEATQDWRNERRLGR